LERPTDKLDEQTDAEPGAGSPLPQAELNPLMNPVLSRHMGRWAEVYFTTPPERRDEAVLELLRELSAQAGPTEERAPVENEVSGGGHRASEFPSFYTNGRHDEPAGENPVFPQPDAASPTSASPLTIRTHFVECQSCGARNLIEQRFCGMCGHSLLPALRGAYADVAQPAASRPEASPAPSAPAMDVEAPSPAGFFPDQAPAEPEPSAPRSHIPWARNAPTHIPAPPSYAADSRSTRQFALGNDHLQRLRDANDLPAFAREPANTRRFGISVYLGAAIVLVFGALVYIAWRGQQVWSSNPHVHPNVAPSMATYAGSSEAPNLQPQPPAEPPPQLPAASAAKGNGASAAPPSAASRPPATRAAAAPRQETQPAADSIQPASLEEPAAAAAPENGRQELETAKTYLNGGVGGVRDSNMAAKWLWKSVAKKNTEATVLLSDLYLKGDGVQHDCDQARLLLDAAAIKHSAAAAERLRNLQAYGCQ
jgi:hypothetical protein